MTGRNQTGRYERAGQESAPLTPRDRELARFLCRVLGFQQKRVAALFDCNQGRIAEAVGEVTPREKD